MSMATSGPSPSSPWTVVELPAGARQGFQPYGGGLQLWKNKDPEVIISGPAETGKTRTALEKLDALMWKYPGAQAIIVRKTYKSLKTSVLLTFEKKVLGAWDPNAGGYQARKFNPKKPMGPGELLFDCKGNPIVEHRGAFDQRKTPVIKLGGEHVEGYLYPNGSHIYLGGMDVPDKVLSSEWDIVYINQAEELTLNDWEIITTRTTGRAGNMPYAQVMADCNPGAPMHWIRARAEKGRLKFIESRHEDNPTLFDPVTHQITEQGKRSLTVLDNLTGVRYLRLRLGKWAAAEGVIYEEFDREIHIINPFLIPKDWVRFRAIDFGYTNPFVCQWWAMDPDGRLYLYREIYMTHRLVEDLAIEINKLSQGELISATICDHDAEDRATLEKDRGPGNPGIPTKPAMKAVSLGIQAVQGRIRRAGDGKPRIFIMAGALVEADPILLNNKKPVCTEQEIESYIWTPTKDSRSNKEDPLKENDHGMDPMRYIVCYVDDVKPVEEPKPQQQVYVINDDTEI
jgi:PBSX family phage terminase large subunit